MSAPELPHKCLAWLLVSAFILTWGSIPAHAAPTTPSLASRIPGGAYTFIETSGLSKIISDVRGSELLDGFLQSEDFELLRKKKWFKQIESSTKTAEFVLRMSLWEASSKLLGGRMGFAVYPAEDGGDPEVTLLVRPAEPSEWLKQQVWSAPLLRVGLKRIERVAFGSEVAAYRTRGFNKEKATYFALHNDWIAVSSTERLLKKTVVLQDPPGAKLEEAGSRIGDEAPYQRMTKRMGAAHLGRAFIDTQRVAKLAESAGPNFGLPEHINDPMLSLFLGGVSELLNNSKFAGFVLNLDGKQLRFASGIDARPQDVDERYRIFFSQNPSSGMQPLPEVGGLIGGFTLYRQFGSWYRKRGDVLKDSIIPGIEGFQGNIGDLLLGQTDASGKSAIGDKIAFVTAMRSDAGAESNGAALPGFAFVVDLARPEEADKTMDSIFEAVLADISHQNDEKFSWKHGEEKHLTERIKFATTKTGGKTLIPAIATVGDKLVVSSSRQLCRDLITLVKKDRGVVKGKDLVFHLRSAPLSSLLETNRQQYHAQLIREGRSEKQALDDLKNIDNMLAMFSSLEGSTTSSNGIFEMNVRGKLK